MDIYDDMLRSTGLSEINESDGTSKSEFGNHQFYAIFGKYLRVLINKYGIGCKCVEN